MATVHVGTAGFVRPRPRYSKRLAFVELELRAPYPAAKALARWRREVGDAFVFALVAPATLWGERDWPLRDAGTTRAELAALEAVAKQLKPRAVLLRTPAAVRPGSVAFNRFVELLDQAKRLAPVVVWEPQGVWEHEAAREAVASRGVVVVSDPLRDPVEGETTVYARMRGLGGDRRYHEGRLEDLSGALAEAEEAFVVFDTASAFTEATKLVRVLGEAEAGGDEEGEEGDEGEEDESEEGADESEEGEESEDEESDEESDEDDEDDEESDEDEDGDEASDEDDEDGDDDDEDDEDEDEDDEK